MNKTKCMLSVLAAFWFVITCATAGHASAQRTFVAGPGIGNDANTASDCPFSAPCRNFSAAFSVTNTGGEIIALSAGTGYGGLTINRAVTVTGLPGQVAFVAVTAGSTGFLVSAGASELVVVQNITFNGSGAAGSTGLSHASGRLVVKNCVFSQLTTGINVTNAKMDLISSDLFNNGTAVNVVGTGTENGAPFNTPAVSQVRINGGNITNNTVGLNQNNPGFNGNANNLFNIVVFAFANTANLNMAANTTPFACTGNSGPPSNNPCQAQPATYNLSTQLH